MADWRARILQEFVPEVDSLTVVADPDGLVLEEGVIAAVRSHGFEIIEYDDPIEFRFALASKRADCRNSKRGSEIVVVSRRPAQYLDSLPHDVLETGRRLHFSLGDLFPNLSYPVLAALDRADLDALYQAQKQYKPGDLGDNGTKEFVLRHVFEMVPDHIKKPSDLLRVLLRRHRAARNVPPKLDDRFIAILRQQREFQDWPLEIIVPGREHFLPVSPRTLADLLGESCGPRRRHGEGAATSCLPDQRPRRPTFRQ